MFYQFGKFLTQTPGEPIIDQHVLRAFAVFTTNDDLQISIYRKIDVIEKKHKTLIFEYKKWLSSTSLQREVQQILDYTYHIDKLLFAVGKTIKTTKTIKL